MAACIKRNKTIHVIVCKVTNRSWGTLKNFGKKEQKVEATEKRENPVKRIMSQSQPDRQTDMNNKGSVMRFPQTASFPYEQTGNTNLSYVW